jgi:hypothetical protein
MSAWTVEQVLALAPDPASAKAGQGLGNPSKWLQLQHDATAVWGQVQGSGKDPYRTQVDLSGPAFHCSCPSRKFPCKHGLGLMLVFAAQPGKVAEAAPPAWVTEWLAKREASAERKAAKAQAAENPDADPEAAARREAARAKTAARREDSVRAGMEELQVWLGDTVRHGLAHARQNAARSWDAMGARLVDAKAPGVARLVREMAGLAVATEDWADHLLERLGALHLLVAGHARLEALAAPTAADVRTAIGWTFPETELAKLPAVAGHWQILGQRVEEEDRLRVLRTWLVNQDNRQPALILNFAAPGQALPVVFCVGTVLDADLAFYPSNFPLRATIRAQRGEPAPLREGAGFDHFAEAFEFSAGALAANPWLERLPWFVRGCVPSRVNDRWFLRDQTGAAVALSPSFQQGWTLAAMSGGHPITVFGEWNGHGWLPLSVLDGQQCIPLGGTV